jgi:hypothetical protein
MTPADVAGVVRADMATLTDARVRAHVTSLLVSPPRPLRVWVPRYSGEVYDGFLVLSHPSGAAIAYCPRDYDPAVPWGLIFAPNEPPASEALSHDWYPRFLDVYFDSRAAPDVAIWRVRERRPRREPAWVSGELSWDEAWARVYALRASSPECQYDCEHAVLY